MGEVLDDVILVKDTQDALQEFVGCAFCAGQEEDQDGEDVLPLGCGSNGKSVFFDAVINVWERQCVVYGDG